MAESDEEIYRRHFEMESERIRKERIKAKAVADARRANRSKKEIKLEKETKALKQKIKRKEKQRSKAYQKRIELCDTAGWGAGISFVLMLVLAGLAGYVPEGWVILEGILVVLFYVALASTFLCFVVWAQPPSHHDY